MERFFDNRADASRAAAEHIAGALERRLDTQNAASLVVSGGSTPAECFATLGGMPFPVDDWQIDAASAGLQKCLSGPSGSAPITFNERVVEIVSRRRHIEQGIRPEGFEGGEGAQIRSNYFDLPMLMDYWSDMRLNHHTEATSMLYGAREAFRIALAESSR